MPRHVFSSGQMHSPDLIPDLPHDLALECLSRLHFSVYPLASRVSPHWRHLLHSHFFYRHRKKSGRTRNLACLIQALPPQYLAQDLKLTSSPPYGITVFDPLSLTWERLPPVPDFPLGLPLFCQTASSRGKLVLMGGWDPVSYQPLTDVFVYDFRTSQWRRGKEMPSRRSFFAIGSCGDRVYVAGGHDENKNALKTASVYDVVENEWSELPPMSQERDECEGRVVGEEFWVISGYPTEQQGMFEGSADAYEFRSGQWRRVEGVWKAGRCPRSCVGVGRDGTLVSWGELESEPRVGVCGVMLGSTTMVIGSEYQGGQHGFYLQEGQNCKLRNIIVPDDFSGFVQSGCCVEI
ncbi:F-box/kelch-repeat protein At1g15670-like [Neltuma alba]|uniref:F-box/kelch-repeat protein At1g15670-like n=1 Tax=Neltuma alba TaxID=207710 RepID=UPI0010A4E153|nr:F-box/kelch-repeat protein At1g15670-like [Prosopis alba]